MIRIKHKVRTMFLKAEQKEKKCKGGQTIEV